MTNLNTTREALIVEALGEAARLIRQVEALAPALDNSCQKLAAAHSGLASQLTAFQARVLDLTERAKVQALGHIQTRTAETARHSMEAQAEAMANAAKQLFDSRVDPRIQQLARVITHQVDRIGHPWERWWTHAATALASSVATLAIVTHFWPR
jgi:hypothetical protein